MGVASAEESTVATQMLWILALYSAFAVDGYHNGQKGQKSSHQECERLTAFAKKATNAQASGDGRAGPSRPPRPHQDGNDELEKPLVKLWDHAAALATSAIPLDGVTKVIPGVLSVAEKESHLIHVSRYVYVYVFFCYSRGAIFFVLLLGSEGLKVEFSF